jgi:hypothetical protein
VSIPEGTGSAVSFSPRLLGVLYLAFWGGQFAIWLPAYYYARIYQFPFASALIDVLSWMMVGTLSMAVGFMLPYRDGAHVRQFLAILSGAIGLVMVRLAIIEALGPVFEWVLPSRIDSLMTFLPRHVLITTSYVGLGCGLRSAWRGEREQARLTELDLLISNTRLLALRARSRPKLLLQEMQAIADQMTTDPRIADARVLRLSDLLRLQLARAQRTRVSVAEEIEFIHRYIEVDQSSSSAPAVLHVSLAADSGILLIPPNSVLTLVEVALRSCAGSFPAGCIQLETTIVADELHVTVADDCSAPAGDPTSDRWRDFVDLLSEDPEHEFGESFAPEFLAVPGGVVSRIRLAIERPQSCS